MSDKLRLVLVDDSRSALAKLESMLRALESVEVVGTAMDGVMAITVVGQKRPDLVLMDIVMPNMDGIAALRLSCAASSRRCASRSSPPSAAPRTELGRPSGSARCRWSPSPSTNSRSNR